jgi:hypothetical protein
VTGVIAWEYYPVGGGNSHKIVFCEDPAGAWFFDKDGGAFWLLWNNNSHSWGNYQNFDANYTWHMGGDVFEINDTLYALDATMKGHHIYFYNGASWQNFREDINDYYQYHDAQFFTDDEHNGNVKWFLVSTWQEWYGGTQAYLKGIYLITNGQAPVAGQSYPISYNPGGGGHEINTVGKTYHAIYRDPADPQVFYTWYGAAIEGDPIDFQKIKVVEDGLGDFEIDEIISDFDVELTPGFHLTLYGISGFYQYVVPNPPDPPQVHQYLLAETDLYNPREYEVFYRTGDLGADDWELIWNDVNGEAGTNNPGGLAGRVHLQNQFIQK